MKNKSIFINTLISVVIIILSVFIAYSLNYLLINNLVIGDECAYDTNNIKTSTVFNLFYEISSNTGYHPEPSFFNFIFTAFLGIVLGLILSLKFVWKKKARNANTRYS